MAEYLFDQPLFGMEIIVFDLETTGVSPAKHAIIQFGLVKLQNGTLSDGWNQLINPGPAHLPLPVDIVNLTGITDATLTDEPDLAFGLSEFDFRVGERVVAGHKVDDFDLKFIRKADQPQQIQTDYSIDTIRLTKKLRPGQPSNLDAAAEHFGIPFDPSQWHNAFYDATIAAQILASQIEELATLNVVTYQDYLDFIDTGTGS